MSTTTLDSGRDILARERLIDELRRRALQRGDFILSSGARTSYLIDAKRVTGHRDGFALLMRLLPAYVEEWQATAIGGLTMGADAIAYAGIASGAVEKAFNVRKEPKGHGMGRRIEGPELGPDDRCLVVDDVVTTGASTVKAIAALQEQGLTICGVVAVLDRLAGGRARIETASGAPFVALTTIDDVYPDRPEDA